MSSHSKPKIVKRMFPGPAGLLPEVKNLNVNIESLEESPEKFCSQHSARTFEDDTWSEMKTDFESDLLKKYNVQWIITNVKSGLLKEEKVSFLAVKIKDVKARGNSLELVLEDPTGEIEAVVSEEIHKEFLEFLTVGSVVVLKNFGVLSISSTKRQYIVVTVNNLVKIYSLISSGDIGDEKGMRIVTVRENSPRAKKFKLEDDIKKLLDDTDMTGFFDDF